MLDRNKAIAFARSLLENKDNFLILDTETTGIGDNDVIIQIGVIDLDGNVLLDSFVKPTKIRSIPTEATEIHGIRYEDLTEAPKFSAVLDELVLLAKPDRKFLIYNFKFDTRLIKQTKAADRIRNNFEFKGFCIMLLYAEFFGHWNPISKSYRYKKLPSSNHSAVGDCQATLELIKYIAKQELSLIPEDYRPTAGKIKQRGTCLRDALVLLFFVWFAIWLFFC